MNNPVTKNDLQLAIQASEKRLTETIEGSEKRLTEKLDSMTKDFQDTKDEMTLQMGKYTQINDIEERVDILENQVIKLIHTPS